MGNPLLHWWERAQKFPGGRFLLTKLICHTIPYTGSVRPQILDLEPGYAKVCIRDRRRLRNHLRSVHAIAQMNLAEFTTGLAMTSLLSNKSRAIITGLSMEYIKKARGTITAECTIPEIDESGSQEHRIVSVVRDKQGEIVSRAEAIWLIGPQKRPERNAHLLPALRIKN